MDVDNGPLKPRERPLKGPVVFSKSEELTITLHAQLPVEVEKVLKNVGKYLSFSCLTQQL